MPKVYTSYCSWFGSPDYRCLIGGKLILYHFLFKGRHATQDEVAASAFQAVDLDQKYGGEPVQVRVTMGKEPRHFMSMFKGKMVIFEVRCYILNYLFRNISLHLHHTSSLFIFFRGAHLEKGQLTQNHQ